MANTFAGGRLNREGIYRHLGFPDHVLRAGHYAVAHGCQRASRRVIIGDMLVPCQLNIGQYRGHSRVFTPYCVRP